MMHVFTKRCVRCRGEFELHGHMDTVPADPDEREVVELLASEQAGWIEGHCLFCVETLPPTEKHHEGIEANQ